MAEELIYCPSCNHKLMLPEEMMGTLVQCPMCRGMFTAPRRRPAPPPPPAPDVVEVVPAGQPSPPLGEGSPPPLPAPEAGPYPPAAPPQGGSYSPPAPPRAGPFSPDERVRAPDRYATPYGAPPGYPPRPEFRDRKSYAFIRVLPPAIGILVGTLLNLFLNLVDFLMFLSPQTYEEAMAEQNKLFRSFGLEEQHIPWGVYLGVRGGFMFINLLIAIGAISMMRLKIYALALITGILAMLNCTSPCCFVSVICGLWAVIMLVQPRVREGFD